MRSAFAKEVLRSISRSWGRFLAIAIMATLGCGFYAGLCMTGPDMRIAGDTYYDATNLMDLRVVSAAGLSDDEVDIIRGVSGVEGVMPAYEADAVSMVDGTQYTLRFHSLDVAAAQASSCDDGLTVASDDADYINRPILTQGSWPAADDECVVSADTVWQNDVKLGSTVRVVEATGKLKDTFSVREFTVVGFVRSSYYTGTTSVGSTALGSGTLASFAYVPEGSFAEDYPYTEAFVTVAGARDAAWPGDAYQEAVDVVAQRIESASGSIASSRLDGLTAEAQDKLDDKRADYEDEKADALSELDDAASQLDDAKAQLDTAAAQLASSRAKIAKSEQQLAAGEKKLKDGQAKLDKQKKKANAKFAAAQKKLDAAQSSYDEAMTKRAQLQEQLAAAQVAGMTDAAAQLEAAIAQIDAQTDGVPAQIAAGKKQLASQRTAAEKQFKAAQKKLDSSKAELDAGKKELEAGKKKLAAGQAEYEAGLAEYESGRAEYEQGSAEADEKFADAEAKLADAQDEVDDIADMDSDVYVMDRTKNMGAESYKSDAGRIDQIAQVFPLLFFLVAALVSLTTMTRMVDEERILIGTYKALGYGKARIASKYLVYVLVASGIGAIVGIALLSQFLPWFIMNAYGIIYALPCAPTPLDPALTAMAAGLGVGINVVATLAAAMATLRESPAALMLPRAPKAGKRILLERIGPLWRRMSFSWKVTARNLFRYKRRFFMAIIGIAGCTALLLTGLGLQNAINDIIDKQFGEIYHYNTIVRLDTDASDGEVDEAGEVVAAASSESAWLATSNKTVRAAGADDGDQRVELVVPAEPDAFGSFVTMRTRSSHEPLSLGDDGVVVSEKLATKLGVSAGDVLDIYDEDDAANPTGAAREVRVSGVMENYVSQYAFMSPQLYAEVYGELPEYATLYANLSAGVSRDAFSDEALALPAVKTLTYNDETIDSYRTMLKTVDSVVIILVIAAALLAFVVLYNLTNINITERLREIATLKVLGFWPGEVNAYIYRETLLLSVIGAVVGCFLGIAMEGFVVVTAEVDQVMFGREIHAWSFAVAFVLTMLFSVIVTVFMRGKLRAIDMVESLKANE